MVQNLLRLLTVLLALSFLISCSHTQTGRQTILQTFDGLSTNYEAEGSIFIPQHRYFSVNGIMPFSEVGSFFHFRPQRGAVTALGISPTEKSYVCVQSIIPEAGYDLQTIKKEMIEVQKKGAIVVLNYYRLWEARKSKTENNINKLNDNFSSSKTLFEKSKYDLRNKLTKKGILIYRWSEGSNESANASASPVISVTTDSSSNFSGYGIIAGLRSSSLYMGNDIISHDISINAKELNEDITSDNDSRRKYIGIITYLLQAKEILYLSEYEVNQAVQFALSFSPKDVKNFSKFIDEIDEIKIGYYLNSIASMSNSGLLANAKKQYYSIDLSKNPDELTNGEYLNLLNDNKWIPFYCVFTDLSQIHQLSKSIVLPIVKTKMDQK